MRLHELVVLSQEVTATRSRSRKVELLADALGRLTPSERPAGISYLAGEPRQPRLELGPAAVTGLQSPAADAPTLEVADVDRTLQAIADVPAGAGSRTRRLELLDGLLAQSTGAEQDWLRALVLRELRQGALEGVLVQAVARAADLDEELVRRAAMLTGDLRATADAALTGGAEALAAIGLEVGVPLKPMLAATSASLAEALDDASDGASDVVIEAKLDGARIQAHRTGDEVRVFTRNLLDVTTRVPGVVSAVRALPCRAAVLDGEAIAFDDEGRPLAFQETMQRFGRERDATAAEADLHVRFFDLLHRDGTDLLDLALVDRLTALDELVPATLRVDRTVTGDRETAEAFLRRTLDAGHEGVMVKDPASPYAAGRRGAAWRKVKPVHTLDLVVLAAEWGSGRRQGWLSNLHLGARADEVATGEGPDDFVMLGKTFKGLTDETLTWQTEQLLAREVERDGHVVHVRPELVVEIALDGVVRSPRYPGGLALRFARLRGYRPDKAPGEVDTLATVRAIHTGERLPTG